MFKDRGHQIEKMMIVPLDVQAVALGIRAYYRCCAQEECVGISAGSRGSSPLNKGKLKFPSKSGTVRRHGLANSSLQSLAQNIQQHGA